MKADQKKRLYNSANRRRKTTAVNNGTTLKSFLEQVDRQSGGFRVRLVQTSRHRDD